MMIEVNPDEYQNLGAEELIEIYDGFRFMDFSDYVAQLSNNGDNYGFWVEYNKSNIEHYWKMSFGTTSEFAYCPRCGLFADHYDSEIGDFICVEPDLVSDEELIAELQNFKETEDQWLEIYKDE